MKAIETTKENENRKALVKVIFETCLLSKEEIVKMENKFGRLEV